MKCSNHQSVIVSLNNGKIQPLHPHPQLLTNTNDLYSSKTTNTNSNNQIILKRNNSKMNDLFDYYPDACNDGIYLTFDHAVNSKALLEQAFNSPSLLIEADVSLLENSKYPVPIMAHPPHKTSDLTLDSFLQQVISSGSSKGIKLDFKCTKVVEPAFRVLAKHYTNLKLDQPVILNSDILAGDHITNNQPVDAWTFLMLSSTRFPKAIISIGWCIEVNDEYLKTGYSRKMVDQMLATIKQYNIVNQTLTFAVNGALMRTSIDNLEYLLAQAPSRSSLTVWSHPNHPLTLEDLIMFRSRFSSDQLIYDIPKDLLQQFRSKVGYLENSS